MKMTITALFSALCFVGTMIHIPMPSGGMVHLGNFVMILAGLLCGGLVGGVSGSLGMGLYDVFTGYPPSTYLRSFLLKFLIGFLVGTLFRLFIKKSWKITLLLYLSGTIFLILAIIGSLMLGQMGESGYIVQLFGISKTIQKMDLIFAVLFAYLLAVGFFVTGVFSFKLKYGLKCVLFATAIVMLVNMILEWVLRILLTHWLDGVELATAYVTAIAKLPASILTSFITILLIVFLYKPIYLATHQLNPMNVEVDI